MPSGVFLIDGNLRIRYANHEGMAQVGRTHAELSGLYPWEVQAAPRAEVEPRLRAVLEGRSQGYSRLITITRQDGGCRPLAVVVSRVAPGLVMAMAEIPSHELELGLIRHVLRLRRLGRDG